MSEQFQPGKPREEPVYRALGAMIQCGQQMVSAGRQLYVLAEELRTEIEKLKEEPPVGVDTGGRGRVMLSPEFLQILATSTPAELVALLGDAGRYSDAETLRAVQEELKRRKPPAGVDPPGAGGETHGVL